MPRLPTAQDLGASPSPSVRRGVVPISIEVPRLGHESRALEELGVAMGGVSDVLHQAAAREKQRLDTIRVEEAYNTYSGKLLDMETEYSNVKGGNVLKQDLYKVYGDKRLEAGKEVAGSLVNKEQQDAFTQRMLVANRMFDAGLYRHTAAETANYEDQVDQDTVATEIRRGTLAWSRPGELEISALRISKAAERTAARKGVPPETLRVQAISQLHTNVIDMMLSNGQDLAARTYFDKVKNDLTDKAAVALSSKMEVSSTDEEAMRSADAIWTEHAPQGAGEAVRMFDMEQEVRRKYSKDPKLAQAVISQLRSQAQAWDYQQREVQAGSKAKILDAYHNGTTLAELQRTPEYTSLPGDARVQLRQYILDRGHTEQQHARAEASYTEGVKAEKSFRRFWELSRPNALSQMSENEILALEPEMGQELTGRLVTLRRSMNDPAKVRAANMDADQFNVLADTAGLKPYAKSMTPEHKARLGRLKAGVETAIDGAQRASGHELDRDTKGKLMQQEIDRWVMVNEWGRDPKVPASTVGEDELKNVYVPIKDIPANITQEYINWMRSEGVISQAMGTAQARALHKERIEKAMGIRRAGGTREQIEKVLKGK